MHCAFLCCTMIARVSLIARALICPRSALSRHDFAQHLLNNLLAQRRCHLQKPAFGWRWLCLNTDSGKCLRSVVLLRSAPAERPWRQSTSARRKICSAWSSSALGCRASGSNGATRVRYAHVIDFSPPAHDLSCRQRAWANASERRRLVQAHSNSENNRAGVGGRVAPSSVRGSASGQVKGRRALALI